MSNKTLYFIKNLLFIESIHINKNKNKLYKKSDKKPKRTALKITFLIFYLFSFFLLNTLMKEK